VALATKDLETLYPLGTEKRSTIDPGERGEWKYIGRGPLQVTHAHIYRQVLELMERQADAWAEAGDEVRAATIRTAAAAVRADPRQAANPDYTFLFSAAYMRLKGGDVPAPRLRKELRSRQLRTGWMTGGVKDPRDALKQAAFGRALDAL
jgi:hypothetical protein